MVLTAKKSNIIVLAIFAILYLFFLSQVFSGRLILPQTLNLWFFSFRYYGLIMAVAVFCSYFWAIKRASDFKINLTEAENLLFWVIVGGFIGARLYHVASSFGYYYKHMADVIKVWNGGLSIYGAVLGGLATILVYSKLTTYNLQLTTILDWLTPPVLLGQIIGRFGNLFNYELVGYPTNLPWKMFVPQAFRPEGYFNFAFFHPLFLYEALGNAIILFFLLKYTKYKPQGVLFFSYVLLYNMLRFTLEYLRVDAVFINSFRQNAMVSLLLAVSSLIIIIILYKKSSRI